MRILHLVHRTWPYHGGSERYVWELALAAARWGHSSTIVATDAWDMSWLVSNKGRHLQPGRFVKNGVEIIRFPVRHPPMQNLLRGFLRRVAKGGPDRFFYPNPFVPEFDRWIKKNGDFGLVHANAMPFLLHAGYRYAERNRVPLVSVPHANIGSVTHRIEPLHYFAGEQPKVLRKSAIVVAQNRFEASVYHDEYGVDTENILVLGSGIDPRYAEGAEGNLARKAFSISADSSIVLSITAHCRDKGSFALLDAAIELWAAGESFVLVLAGPLLPDFREYLDEKSDTLPGNKLVVTGYISEEMRKHLLQASDIVAAPSRLDAFGIILLDGWLFKKPVIGCNAGGMPDLITDGENGYLVDFGDVSSLARRISTLLNNSNLARSMGVSGHGLTTRKYTWRKISDRFYKTLGEKLV